MYGGSKSTKSAVPAVEPLVVQDIAGGSGHDAHADEAKLVVATPAGDQDRLAALHKLTRRVDRLEADLAAAAHDYRRNLGELTNALITAEIRSTTDARDREQLRSTIAKLRADILAAQAVTDSLPVRAALVLRRSALRHPWLARQIRRTLLLIWWTLRGQLLIHLREARAYRLRLRQLREGPPSIVPVESTASAPSVDKEVELPEVDDPWPANRPLVSVIIPCFNYGQFVAEAVQSVLRQTYRDLEVIIVEGGSSALESRHLSLGQLQPRVRVLLQGQAQQVGANRNFGILNARGRYVCCLDADDMLQPTYIEKAVFLLERGGYDLVSSALRFFGDRDEFVPVLPRPDLAAMLSGNHVLTTAVFRRSFWEKAGGYQDTRPEEHGNVYEDWRLWVRIAALGARFINLPRDPMLRYRSHGPSLSQTGLPMDTQREMVQRLNADVLGSASVSQACTDAAARRHRVPMSHLSRGIDPGNGPSLLLALPFMVLGGAERLLSALIGYLVAAGWRVVIITTLEAGSEHGDTFDWFEAHTRNIFRLPGSIPEEHWDEFLQYLIMSHEIDVLWIVGSAYVYHQLPAMRRLFPTLKVSDLLFNTVGHTENNREFRRLIDLVFVENNEVRRWLIADGEASERICTVLSGVDLRRLRPSGDTHAVRAMINASTDEIVVGFSGRWSDEKGPITFIEIARRVDPTLPIRFVMTGAGHLGPMIELAAGQAGFAAGRFHLLGQADDIVPWLQSYDLLVVPSKFDGRPVVVMEAQAVGLPVLASRVGGLPEMIEDGTTGWLCEPAKIDDFVACIERIAREPSVLQPMRRAARKFAEAQFDADKMHTYYEARLRALIS